MLTVDTHFPEGYVCDLCDEKFDSQVEKVISCADKQIAEFVEWCSKQPFYENTVIVIMGDHARMDNLLVEDCDVNLRSIYNCFINCDKEIDMSILKNRQNFKRILQGSL